MKRKRYRIALILIPLFLLIGIFLFLAFRTPSAMQVYIDSDDTYDSLKVKVLLPKGSYKERFFDFVGRGLFQLDQHMKVGYYQFQKNVSYLEVIERVRKGIQTPITVYIPSARSVEKILRHVSRHFLFSVDSLIQAYQQFMDTTTLFTPAESYCLFIPNTYEFYWTASPQEFLKRMVKEFQRFWNSERQRKAQELGLTYCQIITLASIVQEETTKKDEYRRIAGVYINRLRQNMRLQADPTIRFALNNFSRRRILLEDFEIDSPYNTYRNPGLPPGPINNPYPEVIDAVLNYEPHDYLFFCASVDSPGYHVFSKTYEEHLFHATQYQKWLNRNKIFR
jgi:UPF0755 protein